MPSQFTVYSSSMADAPTLTLHTGSLVNLLNKILVTGFGSTPGAGWELAFTSSDGSGSCYRPPSGSRFYLSVQDDTLTPYTPYEAHTRAFEIATSWNSGSGQFPKISQGESALGRLVSKKVYTESLDPKQWIAFVDAYTLYLFWKTSYSGGVSGAWDQSVIFGDIYSYGGSSDLYRCLHIGKESMNSFYSDRLAACESVDFSLSGHYMVRSYKGRDGSVRVSKSGNSNYMSTAYLTGTFLYPNGPNNSIIMSPIWVYDTPRKTIRGTMRGIYPIYHSYTNFIDADTFEGTGELEGRTFQIVCPYRTPADSISVFAMEISNTLDTN